MTAGKIYVCGGMDPVPAFFEGNWPLARLDARGGWEATAQKLAGFDPGFTTPTISRQPIAFDDQGYIYMTGYRLPDTNPFSDDVGKRWAVKYDPNDFTGTPTGITGPQVENSWAVGKMTWHTSRGTFFTGGVRDFTFAQGSVTEWNKTGGLVRDWYLDWSGITQGSYTGAFLRPTTTTSGLGQIILCRNGPTAGVRGIWPLYVVDLTLTDIGGGVFLGGGTLVQTISAPTDSLVNIEDIDVCPRTNEFAVVTSNNSGGMASHAFSEDGSVKFSFGGMVSPHGPEIGNEMCCHITPYGERLLLVGSECAFEGTWEILAYDLDTGEALGSPWAYLPHAQGYSTHNITFSGGHFSGILTTGELVTARADPDFSGAGGWRIGL